MPKPHILSPMNQVPGLDLYTVIKELAGAKRKCEDCQGKGVRDRIAPPSCPKCAGTGDYEPFTSLQVVLQGGLLHNDCTSIKGCMIADLFNTSDCEGRGWVPEPDVRVACWEILRVIGLGRVRQAYDYLAMTSRTSLNAPRPVDMVAAVLHAAQTWVKQKHA